MTAQNLDSEPRHSSDGSPTALNATTLASSGLAITRALQASSVDSAYVFHAAGISADLSNDPLCRLEMSALNRLYRVSVEATGNPYFGLTVARHIHISNLHALGYALATSATLMDFCQRLERYIRLVSEALTLHLSEADGTVLLRFEHLIKNSDEAEDAFFGFLVLTMRLLYKPDFNPLRVELRRAMPIEGAKPYAELMHSPVIFSQKDVLLVFDRNDLLQPLDGSSPELTQVNGAIATAYLARLDKDDVITSVKRRIIEMLPNGDCNRDKVATALCMSSSALQLKLSLRGANFQQLLDDTRKELACNYMQQPRRSITEIAFLLGFSTTGNFTRAFNRWMGCSPSNFRAK